MVFVSIFNLLGLFNTAIFYWLRPDVLLMRPADDPGLDRNKLEVSGSSNPAGFTALPSPSVQDSQRGTQDTNAEIGRTDTGQQSITPFGGPSVPLARDVA
ncbi:hypothetical protein FS749_010524 [Ceratobasidium sp. UAMH 11750]|nr:hypothetical protein FS749_010524 [Ceratobasidium sp. UAMH 11750]